MVWSQDLRLRVNREVVISFSQAKISLQIWNSKEQLSGLARLERLKTLRLPPAPSGDDGELQSGPVTPVVYHHDDRRRVCALSNGHVILRWRQGSGSNPEDQVCEEA